MARPSEIPNAQDLMLLRKLRDAPDGVYHVMAPGDSEPFRLGGFMWNKWVTADNYSRDIPFAQVNFVITEEGKRILELYGS